MRIRELNKEEAKKLFTYIANNEISEDYFSDLDDDYRKIRNDICEFVPRPIDKTYDFDLKFAILLYKYFSIDNFPDFNEAVASNYDFWRYICLKVVPDIIKERHGLIESYFYEKNVRIYIPTLWWYINMAYQGDINATYDCLKPLNTDFILQFVERPGRDGLFIEVTRCIFSKIAKLDKTQINAKKGDATLIRRILIQNTAKINNYNLIVENEINKYVEDLFASCGMEV